MDAPGFREVSCTPAHPSSSVSQAQLIVSHNDPGLRDVAHLLSAQIHTATPLP